jgi:protease-4
MKRIVNAAATAVALLAAAPASAQVLNAIDRQLGTPAGLALPVLGAAAAESPAGLGTTPAAAGFVRSLALEWFRESDVTEDSKADGLYAADSVGPLGVGYAIEWVRPGGDARRYRKNTLALALGDAHSFSIGIGWNRFSSPDPAIDPMKSWDVGITWRPSRHLSIAAATLGRGARLGGVRQPLRYDFGLATRFLGDTFTLSADLLADDRGRDDFHATNLAFGGGAELHSGLAFGVQLLVPIRDEPRLRHDPSAVVAVTWNGPHFGVTAGSTPTPEHTGGFGGVRTSGERYRSMGHGRDAPVIDLQDEIRPRVFLFTLRERDPYGRLLQRLAALRTDPGVAAVVLEVEGLPLGPGRIEEIRAAIAAIREAKPVLAYVLGGATEEYWLATAATAVGMAPGAMLQVTGVSTSNLYVRDALARIGVAFEVVAAGAYKSAPEPLVRSGPSPEAHEATNAVLDDVFGRFVADVAAARRLAPERVRALVDQGLFGSEEAKAAGLVDEVLWPDEIEGWASRVAARRVELDDEYEPETPRVAQRWGRPAVVEIVRIEGAIVAGKTRPGPFGGGGLAGAETIARRIRTAAENREVKAIVLRVDSPGGDGVASDLVWREVVRARARKPVIASMGDVAASGGYLVAAGADAIVAEPSTLTGSIGVFVVKPDLAKLLAKLSVSRAAWSRGENAEVDSPAKPWSAGERRAVERQVDAFYRLFVRRVAESRKLSAAEAEASAGGRIWTGRQALDRRLVDRLGSLADAVALARERARIAPDATVDVRRAAAAGSGGIGDLPERTALDSPVLSRALDALPEVRGLALLSEMGPVLALPVEWITPPR